MREVCRRYQKEIQFIGIAIVLFIVIKYLLGFIGPFILAYILYEWIYPTTKILNKTLKVSCAFSGGILLVFGICIIGGGFIYFFTNGSRQIILFYPFIVKQIEACKEDVYVACCGLEKYFHLARGSVFCKICDAICGMKVDFIENGLPRIMTKSLYMILPVGKILAFILVTYVATLLLLKEAQIKDSQTESTQKLRAGVNWRENLHKATYIFFDFLKIFLGTQIKIMSIIGGITCIGLTISKVAHPIALAVLTAVLDVLPFVGTGIVLIPIVIWKLIQKNLGAAIILGVTYVVCVFARQILEPKLMAHSLGVSSIFILAGIYVGIKSFGWGGMILGPVYVILLSILNKKILN